MTENIPTTQRVVLVQPDKSCAVETIQVQMPGPGEVFVKNIFVAQNPDYKAAEWGITKPGQGLGYDFSGKIVAVSEGVTEWAIGDRVAGWIVPLGDAQKSSAFCEYTVVLVKPLLLIPEDTKIEEAAMIPLIPFTALMGVNLLLNFPQVGSIGRSVSCLEAEVKAALRCNIIASTGLFAIQLFRFTGYKIITAASLRNHALVNNYGASIATDYHAPDVTAQIIAASRQGGVEYAFDVISEGDSYVLAAKTLRPAGPQKVALVLAVDRSKFDVSVDYYHRAPASFVGLGIDVGDRCCPRDRRNLDLGCEFYEFVSSLLQEGSFKGTPFAVRPGGLSGIQDGLEFMKSGKRPQVSGAKLVYRIADTPA